MFMFGSPSKRSTQALLPLSIRRTKFVEVEDVSSALTAAEYTSVRAESLQSFATSQSIIQWSLATYGVLFGAGLLAASNQIAAELAHSVSWMAALIYGLLLPGLVCAAAWSWIGEIRRTERSGVYIRGVESRLRNETQNSSSSVVGPLNWETFLTGDASNGYRPLKGWAPYVGIAMLFGGAQVSSVIFFFIWIDRIYSAEGDTFLFWFAIVTDTALVTLFWVVSVHSGLGVIELGNRYFDLETLKLQWIRAPKLSRKKKEIGALILVFIAQLTAYFLLLPDHVLPWRDSVLAWTGVF